MDNHSSTEYSGVTVDYEIKTGRYVFIVHIDAIDEYYYEIALLYNFTSDYSGRDYCLVVCKNLAHQGPQNWGGRFRSADLVKQDIRFWFDHFIIDGDFNAGELVWRVHNVLENCLIRNARETAENAEKIIHIVSELLAKG